MVRTSSLGSALLVAASALTVSNAHLEYTVRDTTLTAASSSNSSNSRRAQPSIFLVDLLTLFYCDDLEIFL